ncbi:MAG: GNAT family N-acetyltransferase [Bdellovibrionota bacterium]
MSDSENVVSIRKALASDVPAILGLIKSLAEFEKLSHEVVATESDLTRTLFGENPAAEVVMAELSGVADPVGFALTFTSYSTFLGKPGLYLEDLYVKPEFRSQKIGHKLLQHLAQIVVERGYGRLEWSVLDWNIRALEFYERLGAVKMADWTVHRLTGDALKKLAQSH